VNKFNDICGAITYEKNHYIDINIYDKLLAEDAHITEELKQTIRAGQIRINSLNLIDERRGEHQLRA
jgi:hypothetical protein